MPTSAIRRAIKRALDANRLAPLALNWSNHDAARARSMRHNLNRFPRRSYRHARERWQCGFSMFQIGTNWHRHDAVLLDLENHTSGTSKYAKSVEPTAPIPML